MRKNSIKSKVQFLSKVVGSGGVVLEHSPAGPPLVSLRGRHVHPQSGGLSLLLGAVPANEQTFWCDSLGEPCGLESPLAL